MSEIIIFWILAVVAAVAAIGVVAFNNPVRSALALVVNFFVLAFLYFTLKAQLLGITQIMVYAGAIMVLFLFVIMLLNLGSSAPLREKKDVKPLLGVIVGICLFAVVLTQVFLPMVGFKNPNADPSFGSPQAIGNTLFSLYVLPFEIISVLLLIGIVGSILLAKRRI